MRAIGFAEAQGPCLKQAEKVGTVFLQILDMYHILSMERGDPALSHSKLQPCSHFLHLLQTQVSACQVWPEHSPCSSQALPWDLHDSFELKC